VSAVWPSHVACQGQHHLPWLPALQPANSWEHRGKQMAALAGVLHDKSTAPELGALYSQLRAAPSGTLDQVGA